MRPPLLTELLSDPGITSEISKILSELPLIEIQPGFWNRAAALGATVLAKRRKARLGDALIAQSCIDAGIPLLTRDRDLSRIRKDGISHDIGWFFGVTNGSKV